MLCQMLAAKVSVSVSHFTVRLHCRPLAPNSKIHVIYFLK